MIKPIFYMLLVHLALAVDFSDNDDWDASYTGLDEEWTRPSILTGSQVITGLASEFDSGAHDRKFKLRTSKETHLDCDVGDESWTSWTNAEGETWEFSCGDNEAIGEINSGPVGSNDRRFRFKCCSISSPDKDGDSRFRIHSVYTTFQSGTQNGFSLECNRNSIIVGISSSYYDSDIQDREYRVYCGLLVEDEEREDAEKIILTDERFLLGDLDSCYHEGMAWSPIYSHVQATTAAKCQMACAEDSRCARWSWRDDYACHLAEATAVPYVETQYTSGYKIGCYRVESCPWDLVHSTIDGFRHTPLTSMRPEHYTCRDGSQCTSGGCCVDRNKGGLMMCAPEVPFMCKSICGTGDYCCAESLDKCNSWYGGLRGCDREDTRVRECPSVTVTGTVEDNGIKYFLFDMDEWRSMTGLELSGYHEGEYQITVMTGTFNYKGEVKIHAWGSTYDGPHGRKEPKGDIPGEWQTGYQIMLTSCVEGLACGANFEGIEGTWLHEVSYSGSTDAEKDRSCCEKCSEYPDCEMWKRKTTTNQCWLGKNAGSTYLSDDLRGGYRNWALGGSSEVNCDATFEDMSGDDVMKTTYSGSSNSDKDRSCCNQCNAHPECEFWVRATNTDECWLKKSAIHYQSNSKRRGGYRTDLFAWGPSGESACPPGYEFITDWDECSKAVDVLAPGTWSQWSTDWGTSNPKGCFIDGGDQKTYLNEAMTGGANQSGDRAICIRSGTDALYCTDWPAGGTGSNQEKCEHGNTLGDEYFYVYNDGRGTNDALCGKDAECWCCRKNKPGQARLNMPWVESGYAGACQQDCNNDDDCAKDFLCYHRDGDDVPGCRGGKGWTDNGADFCYDPNLFTNGHGSSHKWKHDDNYVQYGSPVMVAVGPSMSSQSVTIENVGVGGLSCPSKVDKSNWLGTADYNDEFDVEVTDGKHVTVTRTNGDHWGTNLRIMCHESDTHAVIVGYSSTWSSTFYDRRFQFYSTQVPGLDCSDHSDWTDWQNAWKDTLEFVCPDDHVLTGISSQYSSDQKDRQYRFKCCDASASGFKVIDTRTTGGGTLSDRVEKAHDLQCAANEVAIGMQSWYSSGKTDRWTEVLCAIIEVPGPSFDDCTQLTIEEVFFIDDVIPTYENEFKNTASLTSFYVEADRCGSSVAGKEITFETETTETISKADKIELEKSVDTLFKFSAGVEAAIEYGAELQKKINAKLKEWSLTKKKQFSLGANAEVGGELGLGAAATTATAAVTTETTATSIETAFQPIAFERWITVGAYSTQTMHVPMIFTMGCLARDGQLKLVDVNATFATEGFSSISVTMEDETSECDFSYEDENGKTVRPYEECACMPDLRSDYVGDGCVVHQEFDGFKGCYVYQGIENADECLNGQALGVAAPTSNEPISAYNYDYPVNGVQFGWSYVPCGGDQFYPGDPGYDGPEYDDLVFLSENSQCYEGQLGETSFESRNSAIQACYTLNELQSDSCLGVYDAGCDSIADFKLCSTEGGLPWADESCVWRMQGVNLLTPGPTETPTVKCEDQSTELCEILAKDDGCMDPVMLEQCPITCGTNCQPCEDSSEELCEMLKAQGSCEESDPEELAATLEMCPITCGTYCAEGIPTLKPTRAGFDVTARPTASPIASPTAATTFPDGEVMVRARLNVGTNSKGKLKTKYFSKNGATISFDVGGVWTTPVDFFDSCKKRTGGICPAEYATFGPFAEKPSAVKIAMKDRYKNGELADVDDLYTGDLSVQAYPSSGDASDATNVCTDFPNLWIDEDNMERTYTFPTSCSCEDLDLKAKITANIEPDFLETQKLQVSVFLPCRQEWVPYNFNYRVKDGVANGDLSKTKKGIEEYPSKIKITNLSSFTPTLIELKFRTVPNTMESWERNLLVPGDDGYTPIVLDEPVEYPLSYSKIDDSSSVTEEPAVVTTETPVTEEPAVVTTETPVTGDDLYSWGPSGQSACPSGYTFITEKDVCEEAVSILAPGTWSGDSYDWGTTNPQGCFYDGGDKKTYFNRAEVGGANQSGDVTICIRTDTISIAETASTDLRRFQVLEADSNIVDPAASYRKKL